MLSQLRRLSKPSMITQPRSRTPCIHPKPNKMFNPAKAMLVETGATNVPAASSRGLRSVIVGIKCAGTALHVLSALLEGVRGRGQLSGVNILMTNKHARVDIHHLGIGENMGLINWGGPRREGGVVVVGLGRRRHGRRIVPSSRATRMGRSLELCARGEVARVRQLRHSGWFRM